MSIVHPTTLAGTATALCPCCREPMRLMRTIPKLGGLPELLVFVCESCREVETVEQDQAA